MIAAFFDIDGTIYRNSLLYEHYKKLIKYELIDYSNSVQSIEKAYKLWNDRVGNYDNYLLNLTSIYVELITGLSVQYNNFVSDQVLALEGSKVYTYTRNRIAWHKEHNHKVIFISGSPDFLVSRMAKKMDADDFCGAKFHIDEEKQIFTGEITHMWDSNSKLKAIAMFKEKYNIDMEKSFAYGDTNGDYSMFASVGNPKAFNPSKELINVIKSDKELMKKIEIIVERKDVVYKMDANVIVLE